MSEKKISVLYLDDEPENLNAFKANFRREFNIFIANNIQEAMTIIENNEIHVVISDHKMPKITGIDFFEKLIETHPRIIRVLLTGCSDLATVVEAINKGQIFRYLYKPMDANEIRSTIQYAYEVYVDNLENEIEMQELMDTNEKLEFMLRQKLFS
ncbi:MAG: response regulator [Bacteroidetes bacterium]|nr:response regulator [Bacteroidota bacterium]